MIESPDNTGNTLFIPHMRDTTANNIAQKGVLYTKSVYITAVLRTEFISNSQ